MNTAASTSTTSREDETAIAGLFGRMRAAWEHGDGQAYADLFLADARYVSAPGERVVGADAIRAAHQQVFGTFFRDTRLGEHYPRELQPIAPGVVLVHGAGAVLFAGEDESKVPANGLMTMVLVKRDEDWKIASFSNTPTGRARNVTFLARYLKSRLRAFTGEWSKARRHMADDKQRNIAEWKKAGRRQR
jgi:uncharacterized protein (TIGR02246 family)